MIQTIAQGILITGLLVTAVMAFWRHGKLMPRGNYHYAPTLLAAMGEGLLIWLAGGFS